MLNNELHLLDKNINIYSLIIATLTEDIGFFSLQTF